ncbi:LolA family protein [Azospirillum doebereinerae]
MTRVFVSILAAMLMASAVAAPAAESPSSGMSTIVEGQVLRGRFVQERFLKGFQAPLKSEGRFLLAPGRGLVWRAETPFAVTTVMSPAGLLQEVRGTETMRLPAGRLPFMSKLYTMLGGALTGDWKALESAFAVTREGDAKAWRLILTPLKAEDPTTPIREIRVKGGRFVEEVEVVKPDGDRDRLVFLDQSLGTEPPAGEDAQSLSAAGRL